MPSTRTHMKFFAFVMAMFSLSLRASEWAPFVEPSFQFYSSALDARKFAANNLTPRGIIINFTNDLRVCFDIDLLRVSAAWQGPGVTPVSMSQGSYSAANW